MSWANASEGWAVGLSGTVLKTADGGKTWIVQDPQSTRDLSGVSFASNTTGWLVGSNGTIRATADGGSTWTTQTVGTTATFRAVSFANSTVGVAVGDLGTATSTIQYTSDGGATWRPAATSSTVGLTSVQMISATTGWAVGGAGVLLKTVDGGASWTAQTSPTSVGLSAISFAPGGVVGYFVGNAALPNWTIYKTTNSGATWTAITGLGTTGALNLFHVDTLDANNAIVVGANGSIRRTTDGGTTWSNQSQNNIGATILRGVKLFDTSNAYAIGDLGAMFYTRNGGDSWFSLLQGSAARWYACWFTDINNGWAVGQNGAIMRTSDAGQSWEQQAAGIATWRAVAIPDASNGWLAGDGGVIKYTTNGIDWNSQISGTTQQLNGLWFFDNRIGFAVGNGGVILKTTNAGNVWQQKPSGTTQVLNAAWFVDDRTGFAVGNAGVILMTTNGGNSWATSTSGTTQNLLAVRGINANTIWASGNNGTLLKTTNGGTTWTALSPGAGTNPLRTVNFIDANTGWVTGNFGIVRKTTDGGATWATQNAGMPTSVVDPAVSTYGAWFADGTTGYLVGDAGVVRRTLNGGATWSSLQYGTLGSLNSLSFPDAIHGWAGGASGSMMYTSDGGQTWAQQKTGSTSAFNGVWMYDSLRGWAVGDNGTIRRTVDGGLTWTAQVSGVTVNLSSVASADTSHAVAAGQGEVRYTSDAGATWLAASVPPTEPVTGLYMTDANNAWAVATRVSGNNVVWHSADGGNMWAPQTTPANANLWDIYFRDANTGYACGDSGVILKTVNAGATWIRVPAPTTLPFYGIRFTDANTGLAVGGGGVIAITGDGGSTWTLKSSGTNQALNSVAFNGSGRGTIVGASGTILGGASVAAPVTTSSVVPPVPNGDNGWYAGTAPIITLNSSVPGATTYYGWTSSAGPFNTYSIPFAAIEGMRTLYFYSADTAGNVETVHSQVLKTDVTSPTAPADVATTTVSTSTATLAWTAASDAVSGFDRYEVFLDGAYVTSASSESAILINLIPSTPYSVQVQTVDKAGNRSALSAPVSFVTDGLTTTPYTTVLGANPLDPDGANDWYVTTPTVTLAALPMSGGPRTTYFSWTDAAGPYTTYTDTLTPSPGAATLYYSTHDDLGTRSDEPTQSRQFKVDTQTPAPPSVTASATDYQAIHVSWPAVAQTPSGIDHYDVYVDGNLHSTVNTVSVDIVGLASTTTFSITVISVNSAGTTSTPSTPAMVTTPVAPRPAAPKAVLAIAPTGESVYLNWMPSESAIGAVDYHVWRSDNGVTYSVVATTTGGLYDCAYIDQGLRSSTRYWYAVSTVDDRGESTLSDTSTTTWNYTAPVTTRPNRILGLSAVNLDHTIYLSWQPAANPAVVGYWIRRGSASMSTMTTLTALPVTSTAFFDLTALNGEKYYYQVAAIDASGVAGTPSIDLEASPIAPFPANQPHPHEFGNESACICHATHSSTTLEPLVRFPGAEKNTICRTCHSPVVSFVEFVDPLLKSKHPQGAVETETDPFSCVTCHTPLIPAGAPLDNLMRVNSNTPCAVVTDTPPGNGFCYSCHGPGSTLAQGDLTVFESSGHRTVPAPPTGANITCDTCHESHSSRNTRLLKYEGFMVCMQCHTASASNPDQVDILSRLNLNEGSNTKHPILPEDQANGSRMQCQNCHNTHTTTKSFPLVDPHDPSPSGTWTTPRSDEKAFCFRCHNGLTLPTSIETSPWAEPVLGRNSATTTRDIQSAYAVNTHGFAARSGSTTTTAHLRPDMGYAYGTVLECRACHDPHGTANDDAILDTVVSADGTKKIYGVLTYKIPSGGKDLRYFCITCHLWDSASHDSRAGTSTATFPMNCKACHGHTAGTVPGENF